MSRRSQESSYNPRRRDAGANREEANAPSPARVSRRDFVGRSTLFAGAAAAAGSAAAAGAPDRSAPGRRLGPAPETPPANPVAVEPQFQPAAKPAFEPGPMLNMSGVSPSLAVTADMVPRRSECGIGAMMPWANRLWFVTYVSHKSGSGSGTGLYEVDENLVLRKRPESVVGTYANRMVHSPTDQIIIGPHVIDPEGKVRTIKSIVNHRLTATMEHLEDPKNKVYFLAMEGEFIEVDLRTLDSRILFNLNKELGLPAGAGPHYKGGHTAQGRVVVANNTYTDKDFTGEWQSGRLSEWTGGKWVNIEKTAFVEVSGRKNMGQVIFATGWDRASAILKAFVGGRWLTYRLPRASQTFHHWWQTEWTRIREVETERFLMDCQGQFYELSPVPYEGHLWGIMPIASHLRIVPDFCSFRGFFVMGGNQNTPNNDSNPHGGQPQAGLWFGKTDDLWQFGKPRGWGGPWWETAVEADSPSAPFLMTGFDKKVLHLMHDSNGGVEFRVEVDFLGTGKWVTYENIGVPAGQYFHHEFPEGYSAHWVRLVPSRNCKATATFMYT